MSPRRRSRPPRPEVPVFERVTRKALPARAARPLRHALTQAVLDTAHEGGAIKVPLADLSDPYLKLSALNNTARRHGLRVRIRCDDTFAYFWAENPAGEPG